MPRLLQRTGRSTPHSSLQDFDAILDETFHAGAQEHNPQEAYLVQQTANRVFEELELLEVGPQVTSALAPVQPGPLLMNLVQL